MASSSWYVRSSGKVFGPFDAKQVSEMALARRINAHTELGNSPQGPWRRASAVKGLRFSETAALPLAAPAAPTQPRPLPASNTNAAKSEASPHLWNPNAAANWSLLFTPAFGAFLHAANWKSLGNPGRAKVNFVWIGATASFLVVNLFTVFIPESKAFAGIMQFAGLGLLCGWYFTQGRPQAQFVKEKFGGSYIKKGWTFPLAVGALSLSLYVGMIFGLATVSSRPTPEALAKEVTPMIVRELQKKPELQGIAIQDLTLVHKGGNTYAGFLDATLNGATERIPLEVTHDGKSILWQLKPANN
jgi:hypothetical protein